MIRFNRTSFKLQIRSSVFFLGIVFLLCGSPDSTHAQIGQGLVINEFMISNTVVTDEDGDSSDWVEIYNGTSSMVDLGNYYLSDDINERTKWRFPHYDLSPGEYILVFASGKDRTPPPYFHTNFKLSAEDGGLILSSYFGSVEDQVVFGDIPRNISYGRHPVTGGFEYFSDITPGAVNGTPLTSVVQFSVQGGFYSSPVTVELTCDTAGADIFYTTNGSTATTASARYTGPVTISQTTTIRAVAVSSGYAVSPPAGQTYFINFDAQGLPVISITTEDKNLWDPSVGIFPDQGDTANLPPNMQPKQRRPIHLDYFLDDGTPAFSQDAQIQVIGNSSRKEMMRPFKLSANEEVDPMHSHFEYPVLKKNIPRFRHLQVRNNNQDGVKQAAYDPGYRLTFLRNTLMSDLCRPLKYFDYRDDSGAVLVVINGKNYGFGNIGEKRDNSMIEQNYPHIDDDDVDMIVLKDGDFEGWYYRPDMQVGVADFFGLGIAEYEEVSNGSLEGGGLKGLTDFMDLMSYIKNVDISNSASFAYVSERLHINSFLTAMAAQIIAGNVDGFTNNLGFWREHRAGEDPGQFYTINYDFDATFGLTGSAARNTLAFADNYFFIFKSLIQNDTFRHAFIRRVDHLLNGSFHPDNAVPIAEGLRDRLDPWVDFHLSKWAQGRTSKGDWLRNVRYLIDFLQQRPAYIRNYAEALFGLPESTQVTFEVDPPEAGATYMTVLSDEVEISSGTYFSGVPLELIAKNNPGYRFEGFELPGGTIEDAQCVIYPSGEDMTVTLRFVEDAAAPVAEVAVNEIVTGGKKKYTDADNDDVDWIELYNTTSRTIILTGKYLSDDPGELTKWQFPEGVSIAPGGFLLILASGKDKVDRVGLMHTNFKISAGSGDFVILTDSNGTDIINEITDVQIQSMIQDHSGGRYVDGASQFVSMSEATPGSANIYNPPPEPGVVRSPVNGTTLESCDVLFQWDAGTGVEMYQLNIGRGMSVIREREAEDFIFSGQESGTSITAYGLPQDGRDVYARLWSRIDGLWMGGPVLYYHTQLETGEPLIVMGAVLETQESQEAQENQETNDQGEVHQSLEETVSGQEEKADTGIQQDVVSSEEQQQDQAAESRQEVESVQPPVVVTAVIEEAHREQERSAQPVTALEKTEQENGQQEEAAEAVHDISIDEVLLTAVPQEASDHIIHEETVLSQGQESGGRDESEVSEIDTSSSGGSDAVQTTTALNALGVSSGPAEIIPPQEGYVTIDAPVVQWTAAANAGSYFLDIASSQDALSVMGGGDIFSEDMGQKTSVRLEGLDAGYQTDYVYLRLWTKLYGEWTAGEVKTFAVEG